MAWKTGLQFPDNVKLLGFQEDIENFYRQISLLVMPSLMEGFGLAAAEASACAVPVIATRISSLPEIVMDGATGLLVPVNAPGPLAEAIVHLLEHPKVAGSFGAAGREHVLKNFALSDSLVELIRLTKAEF